MHISYKTKKLYEIKTVDKINPQLTGKGALKYPTGSGFVTAITLVWLFWEASFMGVLEVTDKNKTLIFCF